MLCGHLDSCHEQTTCIHFDLEVAPILGHHVLALILGGDMDIVTTSNFHATLLQGACGATTAHQPDCNATHRHLFMLRALHGSLCWRWWGCVQKVAQRKDTCAEVSICNTECILIGWKIASYQLASEINSPKLSNSNMHPMPLYTGEELCK